MIILTQITNLIKEFGASSFRGKTKSSIQKRWHISFIL